MDWEPRIGMRVVCIDADESFGFLRLCQEYTISDVKAPTKRWLYREKKFVTLMGILLAGIDLGGDVFTPNRFKPLRERKTSIAIFTAMLDHTPKELIPASYEMPGRPFE